LFLLTFYLSPLATFNEQGQYPSSSLPSLHLIYLLANILSTSRIFLLYALSSLLFLPEVLFRPAHLLLQNDCLLVFALEQQLKINVMDFKQISYRCVIIYGDDIINKLCKNLLFSVPQYLERKTPEIYHGQLPVTFT